MKDIRFGYSLDYARLEESAFWKCESFDYMNNLFMADDTLLFVNMQFDQDLSWYGVPFSG